MFPTDRMRRRRSNEMIRNMLTETRLHPNDLMLPLFFDESLDSIKYTDSMPGVPTYPLSKAAEVSERLYSAGINAVMLFGIPRRKDAEGSGAFAKNGVVQSAIRKIESTSDLLVAADLCMCEYTDHGHCGIVCEHGVDNDLTLIKYRKIAESLADAGAHMIAPSGMMDGQIMNIREALDDSGHKEVPIMAYSAKFCSGFYGPFRDIAHSAPSAYGRETYQMNPANGREAMTEMRRDIEEGADIIMVKPAMPYLDVIKQAKNELCIPIAAYQVSGEYAMIKAAAANGWLDERRTMMESLISIKRAGADILITYFAEEVLKELKK
ncbi:delta-aminolevulinic acid dehydratase [Candidatus Methanoplasma termitum]|uniref:Delta-aminolevulinic acid dehydratase n=1 Tax=Candidatus Methanoplasma termitum TaxID=1577791 RepID=A0A0A7LBT7_9ARCH|nr:porphobilinogen synthase [Candidatus Methanoplasma termitum]AIZ56590.1 delta-aminolevulinic acid dehydratase [Candidatus Methanoplasma termitum]MCL2333838.1 porphobilinogen synthase [Candidatus Methanoplasma sp.]